MMNFNIDEVFELAEQIEVNGARFYRTAAQGVSAFGHKKMLTELAEMEDQHKKTFASMREKVKKSTTNLIFDPDHEAAQYLQAFASGFVFDTTRDPVDLLKGNESIAQILNMAIGFEKDSIVFYLGLEKVLLDEAEIQHIRSIIKEEMGHITLLSRKLEELD